MNGLAFGVASAPDPRATLAARPKPPPSGTIAIVGGGVSGALTAVHLARLAPPGIEIVLFEKSGRRARGLAYGTAEPGHLLNVRAANMSAFPDRPDHFEKWLSLRPQAERGERTEAGVFVSREVYGTYLENILMKACGDGDAELPEAERGTPIAFRDEDVRRVAPAEDGFVLHLASGETMKVAGAVLAMGNITRVRDEPGPVFSNPWSGGATGGLREGEPVLIQGTGLTMIDTLLALRRGGFRGKIVALSRRGLLPQMHAPAKPRLPLLFTPPELARLSLMMRRVREEVARAEAEGGGWRDVVDGLRPVTQTLWRNMPLSERARFLRHARAWWDVRRHRIAAGVTEALALEFDAGSLEVIAGRVTGVQTGRDDVTVIYRARGAEDETWLDVQRVIQATGVPNLSETRDGLVFGLIEQGLAQLDPLGLGLDVTEDFRVCGPGGWPVPGLWALGPLVRGAFWECVAVPDIRLQAVRLAERLAGECRQAAAGPDEAPVWMPGL